MAKRKAISCIWIVEWKSDNPNEGWDWEPYHDFGEAKIYFNFEGAQIKAGSHHENIFITYRAAPYKIDKIDKNENKICDCVKAFRDGPCLVCGGYTTS